MLGELFGSMDKERVGKAQMQLLHFLQQLLCTPGRLAGNLRVCRESGLVAQISSG